MINKRELKKRYPNLFKFSSNKYVRRSKKGKLHTVLKNKRNRKLLYAIGGTALATGLAFKGYGRAGKLRAKINRIELAEVRKRTRKVKKETTLYKDILGELTKYRDRLLSFVPGNKIVPFRKKRKRL